MNTLAILYLNSVCMLFLTIDYNIYTNKKLQVYEKTIYYCDKMKDMKLKNTIDETIILDIQDLFVDPETEHYNDIDQIDREIVSSYLDRCFYADVKINTSILIAKSDDVQLEKCHDVLYYVVPISKIITNNETKKKYEIGEIIYFRESDLMIDGVVHVITIEKCERINVENLLASKEVEKKLNKLKKSGRRLYEEEQYNQAKRIFEAVLKENPNDEYSKEMINNINALNITIEDEIKQAKYNAYSGNFKKMKKAFKILYAYENHPIVKSDGCLYFFMANMIEHYNHGLSLNLSEEDKAYFVRKYVKLSCNAGCPRTQEFIESLPVKYRIKYSIKCN